MDLITEKAIFSQILSFVRTVLKEFSDSFCSELINNWLCISLRLSGKESLSTTKE